MITGLRGQSYLVQRFEPLSRFSTTYPLTGLPPSRVGGSQRSVMESGVVPAHSGELGFPGFSTRAISTGGFQEIYKAVHYEDMSPFE